MIKNFWKSLSKPFFVLAPMANVTDAAFRRMFAKYGKPDVMYTEFVSADGLMRADDVGKNILLRDLNFSEEERPIVAQFFTSHPREMENAARLALELGFDGVDINMGCPDRAVEKQRAGAALMKDYTLARELIFAAKTGAKSDGSGIPVSVKTRIGFNKDELDELLPNLLSAEPAAVIIHARTRKEMSNVKAKWDRIARAVEIRNEIGSESVIIGNGDVLSIQDAREKSAKTGCEGVMIGRAVFGKPWFFSDVDITLDEKLDMAIEHARLFDELLGDIKSFAIMKKHFKAYIEGFPGAKELRIKLMETDSQKQVEDVIKTFKSFNLERKLE